VNYKYRFDSLKRRDKVVCQKKSESSSIDGISIIQ